jgi:para-nitrobenzyl esterase
MRKMWVQFATCVDPSLSAEASPDGRAREWSPYDTENKYVMVFDEFDVHVERESERGIVDWDRTYFLGEHYVL